MKPPERRIDLTPLPVEFYRRHVVDVARELLGRWLVRRTAQGLAAGRIVEVEAYLGWDDPASHSYRGRTRKNASMFRSGGRAYVYPIHARWCFNVVTDTHRVPSAVLVRAIEPLLGLELMARRRGTEQVLQLARGPGRLCQALAIDRRLDGWSLACGRRLWIAAGDELLPAEDQIAATPRIGISQAREEPLRFVHLDREPFLSGPRHLHRNRHRTNRTGSLAAFSNVKR